MAGDPDITVVGNITADPELQISAEGLIRATFTVASPPRTRDPSGTWVEGTTLFLRCTAWRSQADNIAESLTKGTRVIVTGYLRQRNYQGRDGQRRTVLQVEVAELAPSPRSATATVIPNPAHRSIPIAV